MGLFNRAKNERKKTQIPVWFMRQAGRYHDHYQNLKKTSDFMELCKNPELACQTTMGPMDEFDFDAAILFSDLLFPLEHMGMGLHYRQGPPKLEYHLEAKNDLHKLKYLGDAKEFYKFQGDAVRNLKQTLPSHKDLLGFVGAPFTLYTYAVEGSHAGGLVSAKLGLFDGRWSAFIEKLLPSLLDEVRVQVDAGVDAMCFFDTASGELALDQYKDFVLPVLKDLFEQVKKEYPDLKIIYYSKMTHMHYLEEIATLNIDVMGVDWRHEISQVLKEFSSDFYIQGNFDQALLHLPWEILEQEWLKFFDKLESSNADLSKWICGLGHGVLRTTPQENVKRSVKLIHERFVY